MQKVIWIAALMSAFVLVTGCATKKDFQQLDKIDQELEQINSRLEDIASTLEPVETRADSENWEGMIENHDIDTLFKTRARLRYIERDLLEMNQELLEIRRRPESYIHLPLYPYKKRVDETINTYIVVAGERFRELADLTEKLIGKCP